MPLFLTHRNWASLASRLALGALLIPSGLDKLMVNSTFGWRGPEQWEVAFARIAAPISRFFAPDQMDILAQSVAWGEVICGALILIGFFTRPAVIPVICLALWQAAITKPFNYWGADGSTGLISVSPLAGLMVIVILGLGLLSSGGGSLSLDKLIASEPEIEDYEYEWEDEDDYYYGDNS